MCLARVGGGVGRTWGGDACIALGGSTLPRPGRCKHPLPTSAPPPPLRDWTGLKTLYEGIHNPFSKLLFPPISCQPPTKRTHTFSIIVAMPCTTPIHIVANPKRPPRRSNSCSRVTTSLAPLHPN